MNLPLIYRGKVRDVYELGSDQLLIVTTDRISAFDIVLPTPIVGKGKVLNELSLFWFDYVKDIVPNHVIEGNFFKFPQEIQERGYLRQRTMIVKKAKKIDIECIARGYLAGSAWKQYQKTQSVCGIALPEGLTEGAKLESPIFTPSTKANDGAHDENITFEKMQELVGADTAQKLKDLTLKIYEKMAKLALERKIIIADTKLEFGFDNNGEIILIDELGTPDSSRFWEVKKYRPGAGVPKSLDKQPVRDYLEEIKWNKQEPAPVLFANIVRRTYKNYVSAYEKLTNTKFTQKVVKSV